MSRTEDINKSNTEIKQRAEELMQRDVKSATITNFELAAIRMHLAEIGASLAIIADMCLTGGKSEDGCKGCKYEKNTAYEYPCIKCKHAYVEKFEHKMACEED